jgi:hypothetical protein
MVTGGAIMTSDYSKLDTAELVQAADALMAEITPGAWAWHKSYDRYVSLEATIGDDDVEDVISNAHRIAVSDADAAFIAAAPALVRALVTRLREAIESGMIISHECKFKVGDRVRVLPCQDETYIDPETGLWPTGETQTVKSMRFEGSNEKWQIKTVESEYEFWESELERVENG